jgi:hypothetical protein
MSVRHEREHFMENDGNQTNRFPMRFLFEKSLAVATITK